MPVICPPIPLPEIDENEPCKHRVWMPEVWTVEGWKAYVNGTYYGEVTSITPKGINIKQYATGRKVYIRATTNIQIPTMVFGDKQNKQTKQNELL